MSQRSPKRARQASPINDPLPNGLVRFRVDGERFEILEQTLRAKGDTFLVTVLDDPWRDDAKEICVEGNKERFRYILDWYRYGSILLPRSIGLAEMKRDCAFFQLPEDVQIKHESATLAQGVRMIADLRKNIQEQCAEMTRIAKKDIVDAETKILDADAQIIAAWIVERLAQRSLKGPEDQPQHGCFLLGKDSHKLKNETGSSNSDSFLRLRVALAPRVEQAVKQLVDKHGYDAKAAYGSNGWACTLCPLSH
ncbi:Hypothetical protein (Fragment) [Durusdinium trenchii]|uniref:Potassium channel tetramerisation-type BTB domain-containing protein n=1 Tax=Durusdinium trenchii TaxID=1381693 RepID=A0ABP0PMI8_9DINO